jgi:Flp pilus assembly protein TadD/outer membrane protein OmpA-like peptidoglycan-associated protein
MKNKLSLFVVSLAVILVSGCGSISKMKDTAKNVNYTVTPSPLEVKGGEVEFSVNVKYPAKYFNKKAIVTATPVLKYGAGETAFEAKTFQGESVQANNEPIPYTAGGSKTINGGKRPFTKDMMVSELVVRAKGTLGKQSADFPEMKIADGVIATEMLVVKDPRAIMVSDKYVRTTTDKVVADIKYLINKADVRPSELKKEEVKKLKSAIKALDADSTKKITSIEISAYASPDGPEDMNAKLAEERKTSADKNIKNDIKKEKVKSVTDDIFKYLTTAEDWDGFKTLMEASDVKDKELILRVLSMYSDPVVREKEIRNISAAYDDLKVKILPELRRSKLIVNVEVTGKSDEQLIGIAQANPDSLTLEELLYAATLTGDFNSKLAIYQAAAKKSPTDFRAINNVGYSLVKLGRYDEAKVAFEAAKLIENNEVVKNNLGVCAFMTGDTKTAEELYTAGLGAGDLANYNLGIVKISQGQYVEAMKYFGQMNEVNAALAKILAKEHEAALTTLNNSKSEEAIAYYLRAIVGARTQNTDMLWNNLRAACAKSADLKANAAKDLEFFKYFQDATFKSIVQ